MVPLDVGTHIGEVWRGGQTINNENKKDGNRWPLSSFLIHVAGVQLAIMHIDGSTLLKVPQLGNSIVEHHDILFLFIAKINI